VVGGTLLLKLRRHRAAELQRRTGSSRYKPPASVCCRIARRKIERVPRLVLLLRVGGERAAQFVGATAASSDAQRPAEHHRTGHPARGAHHTTPTIRGAHVAQMRCALLLLLLLLHCHHAGTAANHGADVAPKELPVAHVAQGQLAPTGRQHLKHTTARHVSLRRPHAWAPGRLTERAGSRKRRPTLMLDATTPDTHHHTSAAGRGGRRGRRRRRTQHRSHKLHVLLLLLLLADSWVHIPLTPHHHAALAMKRPALRHPGRRAAIEAAIVESASR
jgi:hypothetical protein